MNNNDLKKLLKTEANKVEINDYSSDILLKINPNKNLEPQPKKKRSFLGLKILIPSLTVVLAAIILVVFMFFKPVGTKIPSDEIKPNYNMSTAKTIIGKEILAGGSLVDNFAGPIKQKKFSNYALDNSFYQKEAEQIHKYLQIGEMLLDNDNINISVLENKDEDYKDYKIKMVVDFLNENLNRDYIFYYNETANVESADTDDMDEIDSKIEGIILIENESYRVSGTKEVEKDEYETELLLYLDDNSYVAVAQEAEDKENEYSYSLFRNGIEIENISQEVDLASNSVSIESFTNSGSVEFEMEFIFNANNTISCEYEKELEDVEVELELIIYKKDTFYEYHFINDDNEVIININK